MRFALVLGAAAAAFFFATPAQQAKANYCLNEDDVGQVCGFVTMQQCEDSRNGIGGFCVQDLMAKTNQVRVSAPRKPRAAR